jgi:hypothetical protein
VRGDGSPSTLGEALEVGRNELALFLAAGAVYVAIGVAFPEFLFSWVVGAAYFVACVVGLPAIARRLSR